MKNKKRAGSPAELPSLMSAALRRKYEELRQLRSSANRTDVEARYKIAVIVHGITSDEKQYGKRAVEQLAAALRIDKSLLYKEAKVAKMWTSTQVKTISQESEGLVAWTHFITLTRVTNARGRAAHLKAVVAEALSVAELERRVRAGCETAEHGDEVEQNEDLASDGGPGRQRLMLAISRTVAEVEQLRKREALHDKFVFEKLLTITTTDLGPAGVESLQRLAEVLREGEVLMRTRAERVSTALSRIAAAVTVTDTEAAAQ